MPDDSGYLTPEDIAAGMRVYTPPGAPADKPVPGATTVTADPRGAMFPSTPGQQVNSLQSSPMTQVMPRTGASFGYGNDGYGYGNMSPEQMNALLIARFMAPYLGAAGPIFQLATTLKAKGLNGEDRTLTPVPHDPFAQGNAP